jgi:hypothetical protein
MRGVSNFTIFCAQQAKVAYSYTNTKQKLFKANDAIYQAM